MPVTDSTRDRIVEAGTRHIFRKGYAATGIKEILDDASVPKGSFYHWFESKEALGLSVLDRYVREYDAYMTDVLVDDRIPPLDRLRTVFEDGIRRFDEIGCVDGCLVGNLGQELADQQDVFREPLAEALAGWRDLLAGAITEAVESGQVTCRDPHQLADFLLNSWEGALLRMKIERSQTPLEEFVDVTFSRVLSAG